MPSDRDIRTTVTTFALPSFLRLNANDAYTAVVVNQKDMEMKIQHIALTIALAASGSTGVMALEPDPIPSRLESASTDLNTALIRSKSELNAFVATGFQASPLNDLSPADRSLFINSLTFNEKGLTGFRFDVLSSLSPTAAYRLLSLFGAQKYTSQLDLPKQGRTSLDEAIMSQQQTLEIVRGHRCETRATCRQDSSAACTENC